MGNVIHDVIHGVYGGHNEMGNRPISYQDVALQIFYPFANFRQLANYLQQPYVKAGQVTVNYTLLKARFF